MSLHIDVAIPSPVQERLDQWAATLRDEQAPIGNWRTLAIWPAARLASVSGSTGIEGNPLTPAQVDDVLAGAAVDAQSVHVREVANYNRALEMAREATARQDFTWSHDIIHRINAAVMDGLPRDTHGNYRRGEEEVSVGIFTGPSPLLVQALMDELVAWLARDDGTPRLVRSALLHLNLIAIHPFNDGNGRTARLLAAMALMEHDIPATELISIEAYLRRNRDEYVSALRATLGTGYDPDNHPVTDWLDYYTRVSLDRLDVRDRILDALPGDIGVVVTALQDAGDSAEWASLLLAARVSRLRTERVATMTGRSAPAARALLARLVARGWLEPQGRTRGRWYAPSERLDALALRVPQLMRYLAQGEQLTTFDAFIEDSGGRDVIGNAVDRN